MLRAVVAAGVVAYLPGALLFRLPWWRRDQRAALAADERLFWAVLLSVCWSVAVTIALAVSNRYSFDRLLTTNAVVSVLLVLIARLRLRYDTAAPRPGWRALVPIALVALGAYQYFPPSEYVIGGKDPGTYLNEGVQIAQRGEAIPADAMVAAVPAQLRDLFFTIDTRASGLGLYYGLRFMGFWIEDPGSGRVVGQFPHLLPASIAIGYGLNGLSGARQAVGVWAILGVLAIYYAGARVFGTAAGAAAAAMVAVNVLEVWFARDPSAEMVSQPLIFAACLAFGYAMQGARGFFGAVAGALVGLMMFLRYDNILTMATVGGAALLLPAAGARIGAAFPTALVISSGLGFWYLHGPMRGYAEFPSAVIRDRGGLWLIVPLVLLSFAVRAALTGEALGKLARRWIPIAGAISLTALAVYAYFIRDVAGRLAIHDAMSFRAFGWYVTPLVLGLAVAGIAVAILRKFWINPALFVTIAGYAVAFFYKIHIQPVHFWSMRRFIAVALPAALLGVVALAAEAGRVAAPARLKAWLPALVVIAAAVPITWVFWTRAEPVRRHVEYAGLIPKLEGLASRVGDRDLLVAESRNAGSDVHTLALPLAYIYARNVLVLASAVPDKKLFETFILWAQTRYDRVLFMGGGGTDLLTRRVVAEPVASEQFQVPEYDAPVNAYPAGPRRKDFEFSLYRLSTAPAGAGAPIVVTVGDRDDLQVLRFFGKEKLGTNGTPFRWTGAQSFVALPGISTAAKDVRITMSHGGRPASAPPPAVEVAANDRVLGTVTVTADLQSYTFALPADLVAAAATETEPVRLRLRVATWNPQAILGGGDNRDLGVMVTRVEVR